MPSSRRVAPARRPTPFCRANPRRRSPQLPRGPRFFPRRASFYARDENFAARLRASGFPEPRAGSSAAERWFYIPDVAGSTPVPPTIDSNAQNGPAPDSVLRRRSSNRTFFTRSAGSPSACPPDWRRRASPDGGRGLMRGRSLVFESLVLARAFDERRAGVHAHSCEGSSRPGAELRFARVGDARDGFGV